jgi:hypothetical protein
VGHAAAGGVFDAVHGYTSIPSSSATCMASRSHM